MYLGHIAMPNLRLSAITKEKLSRVQQLYYHAIDDICSNHQPDISFVNRVFKLMAQLLAYLFPVSLNETVTTAWHDLKYSDNMMSVFDGSNQMARRLSEMYV